jgi:uncharacterized protein YkwD
MPSESRFGLPIWAVLVVAAFVPFLVTGGSASALTNCETSSAEVSADEMAMFDLMNQARTERGLTPLKLSPGLSRSAAWKSGDRSAWGETPSDPLFSHTDSLGRSSSTRARDCGFGADAAENIAYGWGSVQATFDAWMRSPGHRTNILMDYYVTVGVGEVNDRWTVDFGIHDDTAKALAPAVPTATPTPKPAPIPTATPSPPPPPPAPAPGALQAGVNYAEYSGPVRTAEAAFSSLGTNLRFVYSWDPAHGEWLRYVPGMPPYINTLKRVQDGQSLVIAVGSAATWTP